MAVVSSHALNGVDGSHAGGVGVRLVNLATGGTVFDAVTDEGGRLSQDIGDPDAAAVYELVFRTGPYWDGRTQAAHGARVMDEVVVRFAMPDPGGRYHIPVILSPHATSYWCSTEHG